MHIILYIPLRVSLVLNRFVAFRSQFQTVEFRNEHVKREGEKEREGGRERGREEEREEGRRGRKGGGRRKQRVGGRERRQEDDINKLTIEARLCLRESCGIRGGLEGEMGGEMERSWTLAGLEKEEEREARRFCPM